jgi:hypothetical protein
MPQVQVGRLKQSLSAGGATQGSPARKGWVNAPIFTPSAVGATQILAKSLTKRATR